MDELIANNPRLSELVEMFAPHLTLDGAGLALTPDAPEAARWAFAEFAALSAELEQSARPVCGPSPQELAAMRGETERQLYAYNHLPPERWEERPRLARALLGGCGERVEIRPPFCCDYGGHISVGENFCAGPNLTVLAAAPVTIGDNVLLGPNVSICTETRPSTRSPGLRASSAARP